MVWLTFAGAGLALVLLRVRGRIGVPVFAAAAVALVCADLFRAGVGFNPAIDRDVADVPRTGAIEYLERRRPARFVSSDEIPQNVIPMRFGLEEARGYDLPIIRRYDRLWRREVTPGSGPVAAGLGDIPLRLGELTPRAGACFASWAWRTSWGRRRCWRRSRRPAGSCPCPASKHRG